MRNQVANLPVPDPQYYHEHRPGAYQAIIAFAEQHIHTRDQESYCLGVDQVVEALLQTQNESNEATGSGSTATV